MMTLSVGTPHWAPQDQTSRSQKGSTTKDSIRSWPGEVPVGVGSNGSGVDGSLMMTVSTSVGLLDFGGCWSMLEVKKKRERTGDGEQFQVLMNPGGILVISTHLHLHSFTGFILTKPQLSNKTNPRKKNSRKRQLVYAESECQTPLHSVYPNSQTICTK